MRTLVKVTIPVEAGNAAIKDDRLGKIMQTTMETLKPEAAYFFGYHGRRSAWFVFDLKSSADIPSIAEPFFLGFNADVEFFPVMNAEDLKAGLGKITKP